MLNAMGLLYHSTLGSRVIKKKEKFRGSHHTQLANSCSFECARVLNAMGLVHGVGFRVQGSGFRVSGLGWRVWGLGFRVQGSWFRA